MKIRSFGLAAIAVLVIAAPTLAGGCPPKEPPVRDLDATICLRDDPRAEVDIYNVGNVPAQARVVYWTGKTDTRRLILVNVPAGQHRRLTLWAHGGGRSVIVRDSLTFELLARAKVIRRNIVEDCPPPRIPA